MKRRSLLLAALILTLGVTSTAAQTSSSESIRGVYIALGDSIAYGVGSSLPDRRGYPALVQGFPETHSNGGSVETINLAVPGETAASFFAGGQYQALTALADDLTTSGTGIAIVTVSLGGNEMLAQRYGSTTERQAALDDFHESLDAAVAGIRETVGGANIVLTTYYDISEGDPAIEASDAWWIEQFNTVIRDTASRHGVSVAAVDEAFSGNIAQYTHAPFDVHPKNQGFRAIARQVWSALGLDNVPPEIEIVSAAEATRRTPTLQLHVNDDVDVASVLVTVNDDVALEPLDMGGGRYILLLDLRGDAATEYAIHVEAVDSAGNRAQAEQRLVVQID